MFLEQIKQEIGKLQPDELDDLRVWVNQQDREEELADIGLSAAINAGKFDKLIDAH